MKSEQINELATALAKAQGQIKSAEFDGANPHFKSKYSTLDSIWKSCRGPLSSNGLSVVQTISQEGENISLETLLLHASGQWISSKIPLISGKPTPQALGSACSYMKRYSLAALVGVTSGKEEEEDDGNAAQEHAIQTTQTNYAQEQLIPPETAAKIEGMILPDDQEYRANLLAYFKAPSFDQIPFTKLNAIMKSVQKRQADKVKELEQSGESAPF